MKLRSGHRLGSTVPASFSLSDRDVVPCFGIGIHHRRPTIPRLDIGDQLVPWDNEHAGHRVTKARRSIELQPSRSRHHIGERRRKHRRILRARCWLLAALCLRESGRAERTEKCGAYCDTSKLGLCIHDFKQPIRQLVEHSASIARSTNILIASLRFGGFACFPRQRSSFPNRLTPTFI